MMGLFIWILDRHQDNPPKINEIPYFLLLLPYMFFMFFVDWAAFIDEFILNKPFAYVKTDRIPLQQDHYSADSS